jgi:hypothetical protein
MLDNYEKDEFGNVRQINVNPIQYDKEYIEKSYESYGELTNYISYLRLGTIIGTVNAIPNSILDVGYGNGSFLKACKNIIPKCYGHDISNYPIPDGCEFVEDITKNHYGVITFFDSLEHFEDISFLKDLKCDVLVISVPECHHPDLDDWFGKWKHRRENEHIWHFNNTSLQNMMESYGYEMLHNSRVEDTIRKNPDLVESNILTCVFVKDNSSFETHYHPIFEE